MHATARIHKVAPPTENMILIKKKSTCDKKEKGEMHSEQRKALNYMFQPKARSTY